MVSLHVYEAGTIGDLLKQEIEFIEDDRQSTYFKHYEDGFIPDPTHRIRELEYLQEVLRLCEDEHPDGPYDFLSEPMKGIMFEMWAHIKRIQVVCSGMECPELYAEAVVNHLCVMWYG